MLAFTHLPSPSACGLRLSYARLRTVLMMIMGVSVIAFIIGASLSVLSLTTSDDDTRTFNDQVNTAVVMSTATMNEAISREPRCENTVQGRLIVTDITGAVCSRADITSNGCCGIDDHNHVQHDTCATCRTDMECCTSYEYCVACCLRHHDQSLNTSLPPTTSTSLTFNATIITRHTRYSSTLFGQCLGTCRTSSKSIHLVMCTNISIGIVMLYK
jgi:hypothetical protein